MFQSEQLADQGQTLIQEAWQKVIVINNQGVVLAKKGEFEEGTKLLRTATQNLPDTEVIMMNLSGLRLGLMNKDGKTNLLAREVEDLLNRARKSNPANKKHDLYEGALADINTSKAESPLANHL